MSAELERVDAELPRERVHRALERERALDVPGRAERRHRGRVHVGESLDRAHVRARVHLVEDARRPAFPAADAERDVGLAGDGRQAAVAARA